MPRIFTRFILLVNSKSKNGDQFTGKEETRCQGGASPYKSKGADLGGQSWKMVHPIVLSQMRDGEGLLCARDNLLCVLSLGACPPDTRFCKTVIKASLPTALRVCVVHSFESLGWRVCFSQRHHLECCPPPAVPLTRLCAVSWFRGTAPRHVSIRLKAADLSGLDRVVQKARTDESQGNVSPGVG